MKYKKGEKVRIAFHPVGTCCPKCAYLTKTMSKFVGKIVTVERPYKERGIDTNSFVTYELPGYIFSSCMVEPIKISRRPMKYKKFVVYCPTKRDWDMVFEKAIREGYSVDKYWFCNEWNEANGMGDAYILFDVSGKVEGHNHDCSLETLNRVTPHTYLNIVKPAKTSLSKGGEKNMTFHKGNRIYNGKEDSDFFEQEGTVTEASTNGDLLIKWDGSAKSRLYYGSTVRRYFEKVDVDDEEDEDEDCGCEGGGEPMQSKVFDIFLSEEAKLLRKYVFQNGNEVQVDSAFMQEALLTYEPFHAHLLKLAKAKEAEEKEDKEKKSKKSK